MRQVRLQSVPVLNHRVRMPVRRTDARGEQCRVQRGGAVAHGDAVPDANVVGECALEALDEGASGRKPAARKAFLDVALGLLGDERCIDRDELALNHALLRHSRNRFEYASPG